MVICVSDISFNASTPCIILFSVTVVSMNSIIFLGRQCFHGNRSFAKAPSGERITILTHFFDPNKKGIGSILRKIRNR